MAESSAHQLQNICVFCGNGSRNLPDFINATRELGIVLGEQKICSMYGSSDIGFTGFILEATTIDGNKIVLNTHERLLELNDRVDAFIALPNGFKTIEEIFTVASWSQQNRYQKPIGLVNVNNCYNLLLLFLDGAYQHEASLFMPILPMSSLICYMHIIPSLSHPLLDLYMMIIRGRGDMNLVKN